MKVLRILCLFFLGFSFNAAQAQDELLKALVHSTQVPCSGYEGQISCWQVQWISENDTSAAEFIYEPIVGLAPFVENRPQAVSLTKVKKADGLVDAPDFIYRVVSDD